MLDKRLQHGYSAHPIPLPSLRRHVGYPRRAARHLCMCTAGCTTCLRPDDAGRCYHFETVGDVPWNEGRAETLAWFSMPAPRRDSAGTLGPASVHHDIVVR